MGKPNRGLDSRGEHVGNSSQPRTALNNGEEESVQSKEQATKYCQSCPHERFFASIGEEQDAMNANFLKFVVVSGLPVRQMGIQHWSYIIGQAMGEDAVGLKIPGKEDLEKLLLDKSGWGEKRLIGILKSVGRLATTADAWQDKRFTYLASTVHWIDEQTLERRSAYLGLKRLTRRCKPREIMSALSMLYRGFGLLGKIDQMTVDTAFIFPRVFDIFGEDPERPILVEEEDWSDESSECSSTSDEEDEEPSEDEHECEQESLGDEEQYEEEEEGDEGSFCEEEEVGSFCLDEEEEPSVDKILEMNAVVGESQGEEEEEETPGEETDETTPIGPLSFPKKASTISLAKMFTDAGDIVRQYKLPKVFPCAARSLCLVATEDAAQALQEDQEYSQLFTSVVGKLKRLWNKRRQLKKTLKAAPKEVVKMGKLFRKLFIVELKTRWDASYGAFKYIASLSDGDKKVLNEMMGAVGLVELEPTEFAFISEYLKVVGPVVGMLDMLLTDLVQPETHKNMGMGYLRPALEVVLAVAKTLLEQDLKFCAPLVRAIRAGIERRFESELSNEDLLVATAVHPMFRLSLKFLSSEESEKIAFLVKERAAVLRKQKEHEEQESRNPGEPATKKPRLDENPDSEDDDDDMGLLKVYSRKSPSELEKMRNDAIDFEIDSFLKGEPKDDVTALKHLRDLYVKTNTAVPACGMLGRLFPRSEQIGERRLEAICFLRANYHLFGLRGGPACCKCEKVMRGK